MKKLALIVMVLVFAFCRVGLSDANLTEFGCEKIGDLWHCPKDNYLFNVNITFVKNIVCVTDQPCDPTCPDLIDKCLDSPNMSECFLNDDCNRCENVDSFCFTFIRLEDSLHFQICEDIVGEDVLEERCEDVDLEKGKMYLAFVDPLQIEFKKCTQIFESGTYGLDCAYEDEQAIINTLITDSYAFAIFLMVQPPGFDFLGFILGNIIYIILAIVIIIVAIWVFLPGIRKRKFVIMPIKKEKISEIKKPGVKARKVHYRKGRRR